MDCVNLPAPAHFFCFCWYFQMFRCLFSWVD